MEFPTNSGALTPEQEPSEERIAHQDFAQQGDFTTNEADDSTEGDDEFATDRPVFKEPDFQADGANATRAEGIASPDELSPTQTRQT